MNSNYAKMLSKVGETEEFRFYMGLGEFTGEKASSLEEFLQKIKEIDVESLEFHLFREDFEKWITFTIGDTRLANGVRSLREKQAASGVDLRRQLSLLISKRLAELKSNSPLPEVRKTKKKSSKR